MEPTTLLIALLWVMYGYFAAQQTHESVTNYDDADKFWMHFGYIVFAPAVLVIKALYGIFKKYE